MTIACVTVAERSRKSHSAVLQRMQQPGTQAAIAVAMGVSESTISRFKSADIEQLCLLLSHLGLKVVPVEMQCFPADKVQALLTLARDHLAAIERPDQLVWE